MFAGSFAPAGWAFCNGALIPISENDALFILLGTTYGGDGQSTFALPNLQSRVPIHAGTGPGGTTYQLGELAGTEQETLTVQQIPNHSHPLIASTGPGTDTVPTNNLLAQSGGAFVYIEDTATVQFNASSITPVGGSQPHQNTQPFLCISFIISLFGQFPTVT
jgi:microcystin-dependent protein